MGLIKRVVDFGLWLLPIFGVGPQEQKPFSLFPEHRTASQSPSVQGPLIAAPCVNSPENRACWKDGFDIHTDYESANGIPPGELVEYDLTLTNGLAYPDGYLVPSMLINGQYPGPTIEAEWGDTIRITVHNHLDNHNGTAIHWHGIRQFETNWQDGVAGVTQCPIKPGETEVYEFRATQYGLSWYHSHFSLQYTDGILGGLRIKGPTSMNYDVELEPLLVSDWYHEDAFSLYHFEEEGNIAALTPNSNILNGKGVYVCNPNTDPRCTGRHLRHETHFTTGRTYKLSIVNTAAETQFKFWIDGHNLTVVQTDFVPIQPYETEVINIGIGQRYDFVIKAHANLDQGTNFWIHARNCATPSQISTLGIIRYDLSNHNDPITPVPDGAQSTSDCSDEDANKLHPIVPRSVGKNVNDVDPADYLEVGIQGFPNVSNPAAPLHKWVLANSSLYIDWREPSLKLLAIDENHDFPAHTAPIFLDYETGEWVYFLIINNFGNTTDATPRTSVPVVTHPIHLHGHDFVILAQSNTTFNSSALTPNLDNPARRDVAMLPANGYLFIAFQVDNPGAWLMHCHIAFHASSGLALQYIEQPKKIKPLMTKAGVLPEFKDRCGLWSEYYASVNIPDNATQEDSGI